MSVIALLTSAGVWIRVTYTPGDISSVAVVNGGVKRLNAFWIASSKAPIVGNVWAAAKAANRIGPPTGYSDFHINIVNV